MSLGILLEIPSPSLEYLPIWIISLRRDIDKTEDKRTTICQKWGFGGRFVITEDVLLIRRHRRKLKKHQWRNHAQKRISTDSTGFTLNSIFKLIEGLFSEKNGSEVAVCKDADWDDTIQGTGCEGSVYFVNGTACDDEALFAGRFRDIAWFVETKFQLKTNLRITHDVAIAILYVQ